MSAPSQPHRPRGRNRSPKIVQSAAPAGLAPGTDQGFPAGPPTVLRSRPSGAAGPRLSEGPSRVTDTESGCLDGPAAPPPPDQPLVWRVVLGSILLAVALPAVQAAARIALPPPRRPVVAEGWAEALPVVAAAVTIAIWIFVFWSLIGSFLNVVVHRLPRGESVITGGSRCPRCSAAIRWHDNLPIIGWLGLGGRCRTCGLPIAERYPIVEAVCAGLGTGLYFHEVASGGANLPGREPDFRHGGLLRIMPDPRADLIGLYLYHGGLLCILLAWGLISHDGQRLPARSIVGTLLVAALLAIAFPALHVVPWGGPAWWPVAAVAGPIAGGLVGAACGRLVAAAAARRLHVDAAGRSGQPLAAPRHLVAALALVGIVCGWQGAVGTTALLSAACLVQALVWSASWSWPTLAIELVLVPATFVHLCFWRHLTTALGRWWPSAHPTPLCLVLPAVLLLAVWAGMVTIAPAADAHRSRGPA